MPDNPTMISVKNNAILRWTTFREREVEAVASLGPSPLVLCMEPMFVRSWSLASGALAFIRHLPLLAMEGHGFIRVARWCVEHLLYAPKKSIYQLGWSRPTGVVLQLGMGYTMRVDTSGRARQRAAQTKRDRTRRAILDAARRLFVENGWLPTTVDGIATEAGVGTATVYNHFPSKNVIAGHAFRPLIEDLLVDTRWADDAVSPSLALTALIDDLTSRVRSQTALTIALLEAVNDSTARHGMKMDEDDPRYWVPLPPLFTQIIRRGQDCGEFLGYPRAGEAGPLLSNLLLLRVLTRPAESAPETSRLITTIAARLLGFEEPDSPKTHATSG